MTNQSKGLENVVKNTRKDCVPFGSHYLPKVWPTRYGIPEPMADSLAGQLVQPFQEHRSRESASLVHAPSRVAGQAPENALPAVSWASTRNSFAPFGLKVKRKFGSSEIDMPAAIENTRSGP